MANSYVRLWSSILDSSIWSAPDSHRIVWITLLAMTDENGFVGASIDGIARRANVPQEVAAAALEVFQQPDTNSRDRIADPENEGRRVRPVERGWHIINHAYYRTLRDKEERREYERVRKAEQRARARNGTSHDVGDKSGKRRKSPAKSAHSPSPSPSSSPPPAASVPVPVRTHPPEREDERPADGGSQSGGKTELWEWLNRSHYRRSGAHRARDILAAVERLDAAGITATDLERLALLARTRAKKSWVGLLAHWIDHVDEALKELGKR